MARDSYVSQFVILVMLIVFISLVSTSVFWSIYSDNQNATNFFEIFGTIITIIGLGISIWQISKLKNDKEIISNTRIQDRLEDVREILIDAQNQLGSATISIDIVKSCISDLRSIQRKIFTIKLENCSFIDCDKFDNNIRDMITDLNNEIPKIKIFSSPIYEERIQILLQTVINAERQIIENI